MNNVVINPYEYFADPTKGRPIFNGSIFIGEPDTDPEVPANQKQVYARQENGTEVAIPQPVATNAGGYPTYNGSVIAISVDGSYSIKVNDKNGVQAFYSAFIDGSNFVSTVDSISNLRTLEPDFNWQQVELLGHTMAGIGGGVFYADFSDTTTADDNGITIVTFGGKRWKRKIDGYFTPEMFGINGDGLTDVTSSLQSFIDSIPDSSNVIYPRHKVFVYESLEISKPLRMSGLVAICRKNRVKSSNVTFDDCTFTAPDYDSQNRAVQSIAYEDVADYENIKILNCNFTGYFYSTDFRAREYSASPSDPANRTIKGLLIKNCKSVAPAGQNAGHFQNTGISNVKIINCETYSGQNATSYNFINGNSDIIVDGCWDENNSYGSLEIENNLECNAVVSNNIFGSDLWIDDTSDVVVSNNICQTLRITSESNDSNNILLSNNQALRIRVEQFGGSPVGFCNNITITGNITLGQTAGASYECFLGAMVSGVVDGNNFSGSANAAIGLIRMSSTDIIVRNNSGSGEFITSSSGGKLIEYGNIGIDIVEDDNEGIHIARLQKPDKRWLDLPAMYKVSASYTGDILSAGTSNISFEIPDGSGLDFRYIGFIVVIRNTSTNNISLFKQSAIHKVVGATINLNFGTKYSEIGVNPSQIDLSNNASTATNINVTVTNNTANTVQVQVIPEFSSRLSELN